MRRILIPAIALFCLALSAKGAFAQANNAVIGGVVADPTKALIPGVTVTLTNIDTGVVDTRLTNESGAYNFPSVPPGKYKMSADLTSFRPATQDNVEVSVAAQLRIDFVLALASAPGAVVSVEVNTNTNPIQESCRIGGYHAFSDPGAGSSNHRQQCARICSMYCPGSASVPSPPPRALSGDWGSTRSMRPLMV